MLLLFLSYISGVLTILSPCILPVIPFVFARADQPFRKSGLPLLAGMALTFAGLSSLAVVGGAWVVQANAWGRTLALILLTFFGLSLIFPKIFERVLEKIFAPLTQLGARLTEGSKKEASFKSSFILGAATGLLWAPCAGPILGLILASAASQGSASQALWYLLSYALGAATSLMLALIAGGRFLGTLKKSLKAEHWIRAGLGLAVLLGVAAISLNLDRTVLTQISKVQTEDWENHLIEILHSQSPQGSQTSGVSSRAAPPSQAPEDPLDRQLSETISGSLAGATHWFNSPALSFASLRGKVVLVDFWTYSCINCLRTLPYLKAWHQKYQNQGLVILGVHTPEFAFEKEEAKVAQALHDLEITYPVAMDNNYAIWNSFENRYWPAHYFIDREGRVRHHHFGEGSYAQSEKIIQNLLNEGVARGQKVSMPTEPINAQGVQAAAQMTDVKSPETYLGSARAQNAQLIPGSARATFQAAKDLALNEWTLAGKWLIDEEKISLLKPGGKIIFRFHARDLHLVLGLKNSKSTTKSVVRFQVRIDGHEPGPWHGVDTDDKGYGLVRENRLYQLIRQQNSAEIHDHVFEIEFIDPGVEAFAFTFG